MVAFSIRYTGRSDMITDLPIYWRVLIKALKRVAVEVSLGGVQLGVHGGPADRQTGS